MGINLCNKILDICNSRVLNRNQIKTKIVKLIMEEEKVMCRCHSSEGECCECNPTLRDKPRKNTKEEALEVLTAGFDGKALEFRGINSNNPSWTSVCRGTVATDFSCYQYRSKKEPSTVYCIRSPRGKLGSLIFGTEQEIKDNYCFTSHDPSFTIVKFVEDVTYAK